MTFGEKLKNSRLTMKLTQRQLADMVGAKHNSVSDWENNKNKPDPDTIELLCGVLGITPNFLLNSNSDDFSLSEKEIIKKYRKLDAYGKETVNILVDREYQRCIDYQITVDNSKHFVESYSEINQNTHSTYTQQLNILNAAHARTDIEVTAADLKHDDDIMDDENF